MADRVWIWFTENGLIRKWDSKPFAEGTEYVASLSPEQPEKPEAVETGEQCAVCGGDCSAANPPVMNCPATLRTDRAARAEAVAEFIRRHDPFGDEFSIHAVNEIERDLHAAPEIATLARQLEAAKGALKAFIWWGDQQCPCTNEEPNPCPLCGASVENLEVCKAADAKFPRRLLADARATLAALPDKPEAVETGEPVACVEAIPIDDLPARVRAKRGELSLRELAAEVGISHATLSRIERGELPDVENYVRLCQWLATSWVCTRCGRRAPIEYCARGPCPMAPVASPVSDGEARRKALETQQNVGTALLRQCYVTLAFAFRRLHESSRSRDGELCLDFQKVRALIEDHFKKIGVKI